jgi:chromosome segregation ATPase
MGPYITHVIERLKENFTSGLLDLDSLVDRIRHQDVTIEEKIEIIDAQESNEDKIIELSGEVQKLKAESEGRRKRLLEVDAERAAEWKRAENLQGLIDQISEVCKPDSKWERDSRGDKVWQILRKFRGIK